MFSRCLQRSRDASKAGVGVHRLRSRLLVEPLEDRLVLSVFNVNSTADLLDPPDGVVTLRSALEMANQTPGNNTINLTVPGTYHITTPGSGQNDNTSGEFAIVPNGASPTGSTLTIENTSGGQVIVDGNHMDRVFDINPNDVVTAAPFTVLMQGFTIQNGVAQPGDAAEGSGGGIRDQGNVNLTLTNMTLTDNNATTDGGGLASGGPVTILNSTFLNNTAMGNGGGLAVGGTLTSVSNTEIDGNVSGGTGGAVFANGVTLTIQSSTLATNTSRDGGGGVELETSGAGLIQGSTISNTTITGNTVLNHPAPMAAASTPAPHSPAAYSSSTTSSAPTPLISAGASSGPRRSVPP